LPYYSLGSSRYIWEMVSSGTVMSRALNLVMAKPGKTGSLWIMLFLYRMDALAGDAIYLMISKCYFLLLLFAGFISRIVREALM